MCPAAMICDRFVRNRVAYLMNVTRDREIVVTEVRMISIFPDVPQCVLVRFPDGSAYYRNLRQLYVSEDAATLAGEHYLSQL